jgi:hypothetical protein
MDRDDDRFHRVRGQDCKRVKFEIHYLTMRRKRGKDSICNTVGEINKIILIPIYRYLKQFDYQGQFEF